jgi:hypothetical protein
MPFPCSEPSGAKKPGRALWWEDKAAVQDRCNRTKTHASPTTLLWHVPFGRMLHRCISGHVLPRASIPTHSPRTEAVVIHRNGSGPRTVPLWWSNPTGSVSLTPKGWHGRMPMRTLCSRTYGYAKPCLPLAQIDGFSKGPRGEGSESDWWWPGHIHMHATWKKTDAFLNTGSYAQRQNSKCGFLTFRTVFSWWQTRQRSHGHSRARARARLGQSHALVAGNWSASSITIRDAILAPSRGMLAPTRAGCGCSSFDATQPPPPWPSRYLSSYSIIDWFSLLRPASPMSGGVENLIYEWRFW